MNSDVCEIHDGNNPHQPYFLFAATCPLPSVMSIFRPRPQNDYEAAEIEESPGFGNSPLMAPAYYLVLRRVWLQKTEALEGIYGY